LHRHFHADAIALTREIENSGMQRGFLLVEMLDESTDAALVFENGLATFTAFIPQFNAHAGIQE